MHINYCVSSASYPVVSCSESSINSTSSKNYHKFLCSGNIYCTIYIPVLCFLLLLCMDIHPDPGPNQTLSIVHNNINSIQNKAIYIEAELNHFDIITLSETWLHGNFPKEKIKITGYQEPIRKDRQDNSGYGGVAIYLKSDIYGKHRPDLEVEHLEALWIETRNNQETLLVGCFYRPPQSRVGYWDLINESIHKAASTPYKFIILGDFNAHPSTPQYAHLNRLIQINRLHQVINEATRYTDNTETIIDIILTSSPNDILKVGVLPPVKSDHCCPFVEIKSKNESASVSAFKRVILNYSKIDTVKFENILRSTIWESIVYNDDLDESALLFSKTLLNAAKMCMPTKTVKIRDNDAPWMTEEIRKLRTKKVKLHTLAKILNSNWCWNLFRHARNDLTTLIRIRKEQYVNKLEERINTVEHFGSKDWWKLINNFTNKKGMTDPNIPPLKQGETVYYSPFEKAELLNKAFIKNSEISGIDEEVPVVDIVNNSIPPLNITPDTVKKIIDNLDPNKAAGPDLIHNKLIIKAKDYISEPLSILFTRSINESKFPKDWKRAHITPVFKKGDKHQCVNYRPISLLSNIGKLLERIVQEHIFEYLMHNGLLTVNQSGFIRKDSTVYQLLTIYDDICKSLDNQEVTQAIFFDISKAFERVWHRGLLRKLYGIGIRNDIFSWLKDYLKDRTQAVTIKGEISSYLNISSGVPQGSVLGPTLFLIYINDIVNDINSIIKLFADDTSMYLSLNDANERTVRLNQDLKLIDEWAKKWKVDFNPTKTDLLTITNKLNPETQPLIFGDVILTETSKHKHLGIFLQIDCKWEAHIQYLLTKSRIHVAYLKSNKYKLSRKTLEIMYKSYILPHFDYCDALWDNCTEALSDELENLNLDAIRTVLGAVRGTSHHKLYSESGLLPLKERRNRHKLILFYKIIKGLTPTYLKDRLPPLVTTVNPYHRRNPLDRYVPFCRLKTYKESFFPSTSLAWNALPDHIKQSETISQFKKYLNRNDITVPTYYYSNNRKLEIIHCKLRLGISDLKADMFNRHLTDNKACECGSDNETAEHFLLTCPLYDNIRMDTINTIPDFNTLDVDCLTNGCRNGTTIANKQIFQKVHEYILQTKRFDQFIRE